MIITDHTLPPDEAAEEEARIQAMPRCKKCGTQSFQVGSVLAENGEWLRPLLRLRH
jgi:hypothetical protein